MNHTEGDIVGILNEELTNIQITSISGNKIHLNLNPMEAVQLEKILSVLNEEYHYRNAFDGKYTTARGKRITYGAFGVAFIEGYRVEIWSEEDDKGHITVLHHGKLKWDNGAWTIRRKNYCYTITFNEMKQLNLA